SGRVQRRRSPRLKALAQNIRARHKFDDLVLLPDKKELLRDIVRRVRYRRQVMDVWGFENLSSRGRGLVALFYGPSGTGKTMGAEVIAEALQIELYRVDLSGVVSKYIGETEKNLRALFDEADRADAMLFFDEADALFGKRSEVRDAHDRYANIEINYLLQRLENFSGIAILATNMRQHLDEAFLRRIHVSVEFAMPKPAERLGIWERSFPQAAPLDADADLRFLADRFEIAGGSIRNIALGAAYLAAEAQESIGMAHLVAAAQREFTKSGKRVQAADFGAHAPQTFSTQGAGHGLSTV
ncbi:MAG TPA: ATP-binding protein, partial [Burkholderiales bacterium]|nr:ATP-binding protein [Burkholderiales bacterium]